MLRIETIIIIIIIVGNCSWSCFSQTKRSQLLLLCRRWRPSQLRFDDFEEVLLSESESTPSKYLGFSADNVREELAELTGIAVENIQVAKVDTLCIYFYRHVCFVPGLTLRNASRCIGLDMRVRFSF